MHGLALPASVVSDTFNFQSQHFDRVEFYSTSLLLSIGSDDVCTGVCFCELMTRRYWMAACDSWAGVTCQFWKETPSNSISVIGVQWTSTKDWWCRQCVNCTACLCVGGVCVCVLVHEVVLSLQHFSQKETVCVCLPTCIGTREQIVHMSFYRAFHVWAYQLTRVGIIYSLCTLWMCHGNQLCRMHLNLISFDEA